MIQLQQQQQFASLSLSLYEVVVTLESKQKCNGENVECQPYCVSVRGLLQIITKATSNERTNEQT